MVTCEPLESRRMMSATTLSADVEPEAAALLVPAVQAARMTADTTSSATVNGTRTTGPTSDVLYSQAGPQAIVQLQLVVMG
jgi:hypothetical protein